MEHSRVIDLTPLLNSPLYKDTEAESRGTPLFHSDYIVKYNIAIEKLDLTNLPNHYFVTYMAFVSEQFDPFPLRASQPWKKVYQTLQFLTLPENQVWFRIVKQVLQRVEGSLRDAKSHVPSLSYSKCESQKIMFEPNSFSVSEWLAWISCWNNWSLDEKQCIYDLTTNQQQMKSSAILFEFINTIKEAKIDIGLLPFLLYMVQTDKWIRPSKSNEIALSRAINSFVNGIRVYLAPSKYDSLLTETIQCGLALFVAYFHQKAQGDNRVPWHMYARYESAASPHNQEHEEHWWAGLRLNGFAIVHIETPQNVTIKREWFYLYTPWNGGDSKYFSSNRCPPVFDPRLIHRIPKKQSTSSSHHHFRDKKKQQSKFLLLSAGWISEMGCLLAQPHFSSKNSWSSLLKDSDPNKTNPQTILQKKSETLIPKTKTTPWQTALQFYLSVTIVYYHKNEIGKQFDISFGTYPCTKLSAEGQSQLFQQITTSEKCTGKPQLGGKNWVPFWLDGKLHMQVQLLPTVIVQTSMTCKTKNPKRMIFKETKPSDSDSSKMVTRLQSRWLSQVDEETQLQVRKMELASFFLPHKSAYRFSLGTSLQPFSCNNNNRDTELLGVGHCRFSHLYGDFYTSQEKNRTTPGIFPFIRDLQSLQQAFTLEANKNLWTVHPSCIYLMYFYTLNRKSLQVNRMSHAFLLHDLKNKGHDWIQFPLGLVRMKKSDLPSQEIWMISYGANDVACKLGFFNTAEINSLLLPIEQVCSVKMKSQYRLSFILSNQKIVNDDNNSSTEKKRKRKRVFL